METRVVGGVEFKRGSNNIFADIGLPSPDELLVKAQLTSVIQQEIKRRKLTQKQIGEILGVNQAEVSRLMRSFGRFSVGRLLIFINRLGRDVEIVVPPAPPEKGRANSGQGRIAFVMPGSMSTASTEQRRPVKNASPCSSRCRG